jgi:hypothetical protein
LSGHAIQNPGWLYSAKGFGFSVAVVELAVVKQAIDFFFTTLLDTELFVKEVPKDSVFFPQESAKLFGSLILAA